MTVRIPASINWLIKRYSELQAKSKLIDLQIADHKLHMSRLAKDKTKLDDDINALARVISIHEVPIEASDIPIRKPRKKYNRFPHGAHTKAIYKCLDKQTYKSTDEVFMFVAVALEVDANDTVILEKCRNSVRYRLKSMHRQGKIEKKDKDNRNIVPQFRLV